jgi:hypothetical protein
MITPLPLVSSHNVPSRVALQRTEFLVTWCAPAVVMPISALVQSPPERQHSTALRELLRYSLGPLAMFAGLGAGECLFKKVQPRYLAHFASFCVGEAAYLTYIGAFNVPVSKWLNQHFPALVTNAKPNPFSPLATATPTLGYSQSLSTTTP